MGVPLEQERLPWALPLVTPLLPRSGLLNFGVLEALCLVLLVLAARRRRGHRGLSLFAVGTIAFATPLLFVALTTLSDMSLLEHLRNQNTEMHAITGLLGYGIPRTAPTSILFIPLSGALRNIANTLRPGWFLAAAGGAALMLGNLRAAGLAIGRIRLPALLAVSGSSVLILAILFARPVAANIVADQALTTAQDGDYAKAVTQFSLMSALDPDMRLRSGVELAWAKARLALGDRSSSMALYAQAQAEAAGGDVEAELDDLRRAMEDAPGDPVITEAYLDAARFASEQAGDPGPLEAVVNTRFGDLPAEHYALGRVFYRDGDFADALPQFTRTLDETEENNTRSTAYTYRALCEIHLGNPLQARTDLLLAVRADVEYNNSLARSLATGLYQAVPS
jgi:tetratricopeptide (TPR) repeat protein